MRRSVNKSRGSKRFRKDLKTTKRANVMAPQRGGFRL